MDTLTLGEALPKEIERVQKLITLYESFPTGIFAAALMKNNVAMAHKAIAEGDISTMFTAYQALKTYKE